MQLNKIDAGKSNKGHPVRCDCGKLIAYERDGAIYVMCKRCKREVRVAVEPSILRDQEP